MHLCRQLQLLALKNFGNVQVEEIAVKNGLDDSGKDRDEVVVRLHHVPVYPVEQVERTIRSQGEEVVAGDGLGLPGFAHQEQLRQNGHRLQIDGEGPQHLHDRKLVIDHQRQEGARHQQEFDAEGVVVVVVGGLKLHVHQVDRGAGRGQEEHLHHRVVQAHVGGEQIEVTGQVDHREQNLRLAGYAGARARLPDLQQQNNYGEDMGQVPSEPKNVHSARRRLASPVV
ncbi:hypothetical protein KR038_008032 [Drosophila bunnanda]|nr:hypothetical protein KR038_008032 [Drosophila bunnanda]